MTVIIDLYGITTKDIDAVTRTLTEALEITFNPHCEISMDR